MGQEIVQAPMTGKILAVHAKVGVEVEEGDTLCILESMKMENPIVAPMRGTVVRIEVSAAQVVKPGQTLVIIEPS